MNRGVNAQPIEVHAARGTSNWGRGGCIGCGGGRVRVESEKRWPCGLPEAESHGDGRAGAFITPTFIEAVRKAYLFVMYGQAQTDRVSRRGDAARPGAAGVGGAAGTISRGRGCTAKRTYN